MSSLLAKRMGARRVVSLINRRSYVDLVQSGQIDIAISPAQATIGTLLAHVRRGDWSRCTACAAARPRRWSWSCTATASPAASPGGAWRRSSCPRAPRIGALVRGDEVLIAHHDTVHRGRGPRHRVRRRQEGPCRAWRSCSRSASASCRRIRNCTSPSSSTCFRSCWWCSPPPCWLPLAVSLGAGDDARRAYDIAILATAFAGAAGYLATRGQATRTAAARRLPARVPGVDGAAGLRRAAADRLPARH